MLRHGHEISPGSALFDYRQRELFRTRSQDGFDVLVDVRSEQFRIVSKIWRKGTGSADVRALEKILRGKRT
jgi:hypothetical protein